MKTTMRMISLLLCLAAVFTVAPGVRAVSEALPAMMPRAVQAAQAEDVPSLRSVVEVHQSANPHSAVIGCFADGTELKLLGETADYYYVDCYDMKGYIEKSMVRCVDGVYRVHHRFDSADSKLLASQTLADAIVSRSQLYTESIKHIGVRYRLGGTSPRGFDCSGFTQYVFRQIGVELPRTCEGQITAGIIIPKESLQCGDLVLFHRTNHPTALVTHVGMYLGDGKLIHAGSGGITVVDLDSRYFAQHYLCARRVILTSELQIRDLAEAAANTAPDAAMPAAFSSRMRIRSVD